MKTKLTLLLLLCLFVMCSYAEGDLAKYYIEIYDKGDDNDVKYIDNNFNLSNKLVSDFMIKVLNKYESKEDHLGGYVVLLNILKLKPVQGFNWVCLNYDNFNAAGHVNIARCISSLNFKETIDLSIALLDDKTEIEEAEQISPLAKKMRICDEIYTSLVQMVWFPLYSESSKKWEDYKKETSFDMPVSLAATDSIEKKDKNILKFKKWLETHYSDIIKNKARLSEKAPEFSMYYEDLMVKIKNRIKGISKDYNK